MAIKFQTNVPLTLTFPFGDFREINGQYGQQFQYSVELAGQRDKLFATPALHQKLQAVGIGPGAVLTVAKIEAEGNRKGWVVVQPEEVEEMATGNDKDTTAHTSLNGIQNTNGLPADSSPIAPAKEEHRQPTNPPDGVGITLFLECGRKGILPQPVEEGLPF